MVYVKNDVKYKRRKEFEDGIDGRKKEVNMWIPSVGIARKWLHGSTESKMGQNGD